MHPLAGRRLSGYLLDCTGYLGIGAAMLPAGLLLLRTTDLGASRRYAEMISAVLPALATVVAAHAEAGPRRATWGKRRRGLQVRLVSGAGAVSAADQGAVADEGSGIGGPSSAGIAAAADGPAIPLSRALLRNTVKIFLPWQLAHVTGIGAAWDGFETGDRLTWTATVLTYATIGVYALTCLRGTGRGPHDLAAGTVVVLSAPATARRSR